MICINTEQVTRAQTPLLDSSDCKSWEGVRHTAKDRSGQDLDWGRLRRSNALCGKRYMIFMMNQCWGYNEMTKLTYDE